MSDRVVKDAEKMESLKRLILSQYRAVNGNLGRKVETLDVVTFSVDKNGETIHDTETAVEGYKARIVMYNANGQGWSEISEGNGKETMVLALSDLLEKLNYDLSRVIAIKDIDDNL